MTPLARQLTQLLENDQFKTSHGLGFFSMPYKRPWVQSEWHSFKIGTVYGLYQFQEKQFRILAIKNDNKNNGHLEDMLEWFYCSCIRYGTPLVIMDVINPRFEKHLKTKRGFMKIEGTDHYIKEPASMEAEFKLKLDKKVLCKN